MCSFNGFWLRPKYLYQWVYSLLITNCDLYLCFKGFFIIQFDTQQDMEKFLNEGPWFWGRVGLFVTPWFPKFNETTMVVTTMLI